MQVTKKALEEIQNSGKFLKISVDIGGCRGFIFDFSYIESLEVGFVFIHSLVIVEKQFFSILQNFELDFVHDIFCKNFILNALNDFKMCGCGLSFNIKK